MCMRNEGKAREGKPEETRAKTCSNIIHAHSIAAEIGIFGWGEHVPISIARLSYERRFNEGLIWEFIL